ncbi:TPA: hypothetical protein P0V47_003149 [Listeria innocua]|uniref:hypothetical protein n=1 Tax=Paracerasibacillus soli TaxID=480284 RepID=UPI0032F43167|nr:hypothetical protein [Listeria innocua]HDM8995838.1 hypothetical protein [Listeria innocua]
MKYLSYDAHVALNMDCTSEIEVLKLEEEVSKNAKAYRKIFETLVNRLPKPVFDRFNGWGFHDYELVKVEIQHTSLLHTDIHLTLSGSDKWKVSFKDTSLFQFRHLNYHNEKPALSRELDYWLFEEFLPVDNAMLSFEANFSSGGNLLIHFPDGAVSIECLK